MFFSFLAIIQVLWCTFLLFHVFQFFSLYSRSYSVNLPFFMFFSVLRHIPRHTVFVSHFSVFSPKSRSHSLYFLHFTFFTDSHHIPVPTMCVSHFSRRSVFLAIFHVLTCEFLIFPVCQFS
jgi:hypothetical protein